MYPPSSKLSPRSQPGVNSPSSEKLVQGTTPNSASSMATASSGVTSISVYLKFGNVSKRMMDQSVGSMEQFFQAGKALLDIPADEKVEFMINGNYASELSLDEFVRMAPLTPGIIVVSKSPKKD